MRIVKLSWWERLFRRLQSRYWIPPKLSDESLEAILIAIINAKTNDGKRINISVADVLQPWVIEQLPSWPWPQP